MNTTLTSSVPISRRISVVWSGVLLGALLLVAMAVHAYNMFGFPLYLGDEGIYMSQAYAVLKMNALTPYAYWYDHAPAGWLLIAIWTMLTGGFHTFGTAVDGGRVLMLVLHIASLVFLFRVVIRLTRNPFAATAAGLLWTLSPLAVEYGRMVLLDNIMVFWALAAAVLLLRHNGKIWPLIGSGICFGIAVLTKENAIVMAPAFIYGMWTLVDRHHARFARAGWLFMGISTVSLYFLYAALREELFAFPLSAPQAGNPTSVSLIGTLVWQITRSGLAPWDPNSDFFRVLTTDWLTKDAWLIGLGLVAIIWNMFHNHSRRMVGLMGLLAVLSITRGAALNFYILSALPFLALNIGVALEDLAERGRTPALLPLSIIAAVAIGWSGLSRHPELFTLNLTTIQRQALAWVEEHVPPQAQIVTDDDLWVDLRGGQPGKPAFPGTHSHWKVANDPAVHKGLFNDDWRNIDYFVMTPGLAEIFEQDKTKLTYQAYSHSTEVAKFAVGNAAVTIRRVDNPGIATNETLESAYRSFHDKFIKDGHVQDTNGFTDARTQATAMLMAVWMDDKATFDELWGWTYMHLRNDNGLLFTSNKPGAETATATEADTDAALALLLAERRWNDSSYGRFGRAIVDAIWKHEIVDVQGAPVVVAGDWAVSKDQVIFAPNTFVPYAYHIFAAADTKHNWWYVLSNNYRLLADITNAPLGEGRSAGLPPAYIGIDRETGAYIPDPKDAPANSDFNATAAEVYWRVGLDAEWHDDGRADSFLKASKFLRDEWEARGSFVEAYTHNGRPVGNPASLTMYSVIAPKFLAEDPKLGHEMYAKQLATAFNQTGTDGQWGDGKDAAEQQWAWLTTGLYEQAIKYQWEEK